MVVLVEPTEGVGVTALGTAHKTPFLRVVRSVASPWWRAEPTVASRRTGTHGTRRAAEMMKPCAPQPTRTTVIPVQGQRFLQPGLSSAHPHSATTT
ncbi:hypothetical protein AWW66_01010 [Micromonospora rosaria]|uniref:Uncharacterized protein n=1 Tax=Micromonospora rosaria TaxID=47874 RepID=A0A136PZJ0_9ACTN|nr:hypothetical protein [Micromonospora rosaria]KXK63793.1 hypothetical protein AWW66_01010 [Micromonospora rosaria]